MPGASTNGPRGSRSCDTIYYSKTTFKPKTTIDVTTPTRSFVEGVEPVDGEEPAIRFVHLDIAVSIKALCSFAVDMTDTIDSDGKPPAAPGGLGPSPRGMLCREGLRRHATHSPRPEYQRRSVEAGWNAGARPGKEGCGVSRRVQTGPVPAEGALDFSSTAAIAGIASLSPELQPYSDAEGVDFRDSTGIGPSSFAEEAAGRWMMAFSVPPTLRSDEPPLEWQMRSDGASGDVAEDERTDIWQCEASTRESIGGLPDIEHAILAKSQKGWRGRADPGLRADKERKERNDGQAFAATKLHRDECALASVPIGTHIFAVACAYSPYREAALLVADLACPIGAVWDSDGRIPMLSADAHGAGTGSTDLHPHIDGIGAGAVYPRNTGHRSKEVQRDPGHSPHWTEHRLLVLSLRRMTTNDSAESFRNDTTHV
ncbi:uncharacterized protein TRAVEDRAFT_20788 [Trametes versicolor FP-101664 SS1]|uniref:uncharacterized protein n=1 Tax=Trametes versicolor (strain FP-101664) TaxID=717944 RepID=UPI0004622B44|nr:uncharacterized protein TRAVEDRAFT_20788 [Trametes versicolor FP-101664 SS1]EIW58960.1 hypothetical protein TRAVEDRAFT_20788 [Trametes versicolor FP-101664 SS1]